MKIFLDTTQETFVACLFDENFNVKRKIIKETSQKVEEIPLFFNSILLKDNINIKDIDAFYINLGPGSFTGSRISLVYVRTIAQITGAKIFTTNSFQLLQSDDKQLFLYANKNSSFEIQKNDINDITKTKLIKKSLQEKKINYLELLESFPKFTQLFKSEKLLAIKPQYGSMPQIGSGK